MIWHIFKKDIRLHWLFALAVAILPFAIVAVHLRMDHFFAANDALSSMLLLLELMFYFGVATLTAVLVHQDSLVDAREDWLVRPIRRRDLLAAKLLFVMLAAQLPLFCANLAGGLIDRFAFSSSFSGAITENLYFLLAFALPIFAFVSLTKNLAEALGGAFALFIAVMGLEMLIAAWNGGSLLGPTTGTGVAWIPQAERLMIYLIAAAAILGLQYFRRSTRVSRYVLGGAIVLCVLTQVAPWRYAFGFEKAITAAPATDPLIRFDPALGRFHSPVSAEPPSSGAQLETRDLRVTETGEEIYIPLQVSGLAPGSILKIDRASVHLPGANGKEKGAINLPGDLGGFEVPNDGTSEASLITHLEPIKIRGNIFNRIKNTPVTLRIDYSATSLKLASTVSLPTTGANQRIDGVGWCQTELNDDRTAVKVRCIAAGSLPQCGTLLLENPATGAHDPATYGCLDDYAPYFGRYKPPDLIMREGFDLNFRDTAGLLQYPVDGSQIGAARVVLKSYAVAGHFTTRLVIPSIRLADWSTY
ncbi:MAG: ABC transporter permease [Terriglobia bacterium]